MSSLFAAQDRFERLYHHEPDFDDPADVRKVFGLLADTGGADLSRKDIDEAIEATEEAASANHIAAEAMRELGEALPKNGTTVLKWLGISETELNRHLAVELSKL